MNQEALKTLHSLAGQEGYNGSLDEFVQLMQTDSDALGTMYGVAQNQGYNDSLEDFQTLIGQKKKKKLPKNFQIQLRKILFWIHNFLSQKVKLQRG